MVLMCLMNGNDRISDFGEAREIGNVEQTMAMTTGVGTPFYMAPELLQGERHYTKAVDVYSYGVMSAQVFSGSLKYGDISFDNIYCLFSSSSFIMFLSFFHDFVVLFITAFVTKVCEGLRPSLNDCPESIRPLVISCWDGTPTNRPCLFFSFFSFITTTTNHFFKHTTMMNSVFRHCEDT